MSQLSALHGLRVIDLSRVALCRRRFWRILAPMWSRSNAPFAATTSACTAATGVGGGGRGIDDCDAVELSLLGSGPAGGSDVPAPARIPARLASGAANGLSAVGTGGGIGAPGCGSTFAGQSACDGCTCLTVGITGGGTLAVNAAANAAPLVTLAPLAD